jgi:AI-2 transport protein TqsA
LATFGRWQACSDGAALMVPSFPVSPFVRMFLVAALVFLVVAILHLGAPVFLPAVEAVVVCFVLNAMANGLRRLPVVGRRLPRALALVFSALVVLFVGFIVADSAVRAVGALGPRAAGFREALVPLVDWAAEKFGIPQADLLDRIVDSIGLEAALRQVIAATISTISQFGMVAIFVAFLLFDQQFFDQKLRMIAPDPQRYARTREILDRIAAAIQAYLGVMALTSGLTATLSYMIMLFVGVEFAAFWATAIFFLNFIPTIGSILGTLLPTAVALLQFQEIGPAAIVLAGIGATQFAVGNVLLPRVAGGALNISLFVTLFSLVAWGAIWGVTGMFVAMPITAILIIVLSNFQSTRPVAILLSRTGDIETSD